MTKYFCDICEREIGRNFVSKRLERVGWHNDKKVQIQVTCGVGEQWNRGEICLDCLLEAIKDAATSEKQMDPEL
jgi:hypothetical protein